MSVRVMPKEMQIIVFKRLFLIWNAWREEEIPGYDVSAQIDEIDWEKHVISGQTFNENRYDLKNNFPEYTWSTNDIPEKVEERLQEELGYQIETQVERDREQHEALYEEEQQQEVSIPEEAETEPEAPPGKYKVEKTAIGEIWTFEIEVKPHTQKTKGKTYEFGRVQLNVDKNLVGCPVKISIMIPKV
jgi:hypothetical protein